MHKDYTIDLAVKRHDLDANDFQLVYEAQDRSKLTAKQTTFLNGRSMILDELKELTKALPKGTKILDVGCGTGHLTKWLQDEGFDVVGIEPSVEMLKHAKTNFPELDFRYGISSELPIESDSYDLIIAIEVLRYLSHEENAKTYKECLRVLRPEGRIFVTQVNKYCSDFYYIYHNIKHIHSHITSRLHHYCNFTHANKEERLLDSLGYTNIQTIGRYYGTVRLSYKFGKIFGNAVYQVAQILFSPKQRNANSWLKNLMGHLIVIAQKP
jgi:2-polyprenyl-3-methyl-5-hydroxy-6-metoxy-1,4-benzoquinol methylase